MNIADGRLYTPEQYEQLDETMKRFCTPVDGSALTQRQIEAMRVSRKDHRSRVGRQLTRARRIGRNQPCPCGSGRKFKQCCLRGRQ